jgi:hypothetical protein
MIPWYEAPIDGTDILQRPNESVANCAGMPLTFWSGLSIEQEPSSPMLKTMAKLFLPMESFPNQEPVSVWEQARSGKEMHIAVKMIFFIVLRLFIVQI